MSQLKAYLAASAKKVSTEDHSDVELPVIPAPVEVTDAEDIDAQDELADVADARQQAIVDAAHQEAILEDGANMVESLENYIDVLDIGLEQGDFSKQFAAMAGTELKRVGAILGKEETEIPAFENYDQENLEEFYRLSLEGFKEAVVSVKQSLANVAKGASNYLSELGTNEKAAKALTTRADAVLGKLSGFDGKRSVPLSGLGKTFTAKGTAPANLLQAINGDMKAINTLSTRHTKACVDYYVMSVNAVALAVNDPKQLNDVVKKLAGEKTPSEMMGSLPLLGKELYIGDKPSSRVNSKLVGELNEKILDETSPFTAMKKADATLELGKADIEGLVKAAKGYAAILATLNKEAKKELDRQAKVDKEIVEAVDRKGQGVTMSGSPGAVGGAAGVAIATAVVVGAPLLTTALAGFAAAGIVNNLTMRVGGQASVDDADVTVRELAQLMRTASKMPLGSFKAIANLAEDHAKACLQLAERALATKALNADAAKEAAEVEGNAPA